MTTYPLPTLAATIDATGIAAPSYDDVFLSLSASYREIYGADVVLTADTQDGQWIGVIAQAITDVNAAAIAVYNSFSPSTAQGTGLASVVKINGLKKEEASSSTCPVTITGTAGTTITGGSVEDDAGHAWSLPASVVIPPSSSIIVTATCQTAGAVAADIGTITKIRTPTRGWLTVTNASAAAPGTPVESDAKLRRRQSVSTALSARTPMESIAAAVQNIPGVTRINYSHNPSGSTNTDGVPAHSFCLVVEGGDAFTIAQAIANGKLGTGTSGSITETVLDVYGVPSVVHFDTPTYKRIIAAVSRRCPDTPSRSATRSSRRSRRTSTTLRSARRSALTRRSPLRSRDRARVARSVSRLMASRSRSTATRWQQLTSPLRSTKRAPASSPMCR